MRIFLGHLLDLGGYQNMSAPGATEGLQRLNQECPGLILLSLMYDRFGQLQMLNELKGDDRFREIPVVLMSSIEENYLYQLRILPQISAKGFAHRPDGFLTRPPEAEDLFSLLGKLGQTPQR
ncbi:MAG: hypothetical protein R6U55_08985 [Desulfovermiculus sp.]